MNVENDDKYFSISSILAYLPIADSKKGHATRGSTYRQKFNELNIEGFDFTNGFECSDVHKFEKIKKLSKNIFELNFQQDQNQWRHKLIPIEVSKNNSDRNVDLIIHENHYVLIEKLNIFLGNHLGN